MHPYHQNARRFTAAATRSWILADAIETLDEIRRVGIGEIEGGRDRGVGAERGPGGQVRGTFRYVTEARFASDG